MTTTTRSCSIFTIFTIFHIFRPWLTAAGRAVRGEGGEQAQAQYSDYLSYIISCHAQSAIYFQVTQWRDCSASFSTPLQPVCHLAGLITCHPRCGYGKLENSFNLPTHSWSSTRSIAVSVSVSLCLFVHFPFWFRVHFHLITLWRCVELFSSSSAAAALLFTLEFCFSSSSSSVFLFVCLSFYRLPRQYSLPPAPAAASRGSSTRVFI